MIDQYLFPLICGTLLFSLILTVAILGTRARLRLAKRLLNSYKDKNKVNTWVKAHGKRRRLLGLISLISTLGLVVFIVLVLRGVVVVTQPLLVAVAILILFIMVSGALTLFDIEHFVK